MKFQPTKLFILTITLLLFTCSGLYAQCAQMTTLNAGDNTLCSGQSTTLSMGFASSGYNYKLYKNGIFLSTITPSSSGGISWTVSSAGTYYVTVNNSCGAGQSNSVNITTVQGSLGNPQVSGANELCKGSPPTDYGINGGSSSNSYSWSIEDAGSSTISSTTGVVNWSPTFVGTATISLQATSACGSTTTKTRTVVVSAPPSLSVPSAPVTNTCSSGTNIDLYATSSISSDDTGISHVWYTSEFGSGTVPHTQQTAASYITKVTVSGQNVDYWVKAVYNGCESERKKISASYQANTTPTLELFNILGEQCGPSVTFSLNAGGGSAGSVYEWYENISGGSPVHTGSNYSPTVTTGEKTYYVGGTLKNTLGCSFNVSPRKSITVTVNPKPGNATATNPTPRFCSGSFTLSATKGSNANTIRWYSSATGGNLLASGTSYTTGTLNQTTSFYAESYNSSTGCVSSSRTEVSAIINTSATISLTVSDGTNTCSSNDIVLSAISDGYTSSDPNITHRWWSSETGGSYISGTKDPNAPIYITQVTVSAQNRDYWVSAVYSGCEGERQKVSATYQANTTPILELFTIEDEKCGNSATFDLNAGGGSSGSVYEWYENISGGNSIHTGSSYSPTVSAGTKIYYVGGTLKNALGCSFNISPRKSITVTANPIPGNATATNPTPRICSGSFTLSATKGSNANTIRWYSSATGGSPLASGTSYTTGTLNQTTSFYAESYNSGTGCISASRTEVSAVINTSGTISLTVNDGANTCSSSEITLTAFSYDFQPGDTNIEHKWWDSEIDGNPVSFTTDPEIPYFNSQVTVSAQSRDYWVSAVYNGCESERQMVSATYDPNLNCEPSCTASGVSDITFAAAGDETQFTITFDPNTAPCAQTVYLRDLNNGNFIDPPLWLLTQRLNGNTFKLSVAANTTVATRSVRLVTVDYDNQAVGQLNFLVTQTNCGSEAWYLDSDGDGLGDIFGQPIMGCQDPDTYADDDPNTSWVNNNNDKCPYEFGPSSNEGCPGDIPENWNTVTTKSYDLNNTLKVASKSYFDQLGKLRQSQGWDVKSDSIWASAMMYDNYGRQALSTIGAPIKKGVDFQHKSSFVKASNNATDYILQTNPTLASIAGVGNNANTLGWYFSESNNREPYQDVTAYPFSRSIYSELNPGGVLQTAGGNKINNEWPQAYTFSMPAGQELSKSVAFGNTDYDDLKIIKTVTRNLQGDENVIFTDSEGKTLAAARSGGTVTPRDAMVKIGEQGFVDIHVPKSANGISTANLSSGMSIEVFDLITEEPYTASIGAIPPGFYRVAIQNWNPDSYNPNQRVEVTYPENYYDYALNVYDKADNLIKTYQPVGISIASKPESVVTYDAIGRIIYSERPDEGKAWFKYRQDGQIRFSQNSKQKDPNDDSNFDDAEFSYTNYDSNGRPVESGVYKEGSITFENSDNLLENILEDITIDNDGLDDANCKEQIFTVYDKIDPVELLTLPSNYKAPSFLSGNVAKTQNDQSTSYYSYDIYGRVQWMVQNIAGLGFKTIDYEYEPITGLVTKVIYQKDNANEQFVHRYTYNEIDELVTVETSTDNINFSTDAEYTYYETGAMKRTELALDDQGNAVQGIDYVYNISGQLKSINHPSLDDTMDPGGDTNDLFGMQMDYNSSDYQRAVANIHATTYGTDRADGNLKGVRWNNKQLLSGTTENAYSYEYDRNNWLENAFYGTYSDTSGGTLFENVQDSGTYSSADGEVVQEATKSITLKPGFHAQTGSDFTAHIVPGQDFQQNTNGDYNVADIQYDANGNIKQLKRNKNTENSSNAMDDLIYNYDPSKPNQLRSVTDNAGDAPNAKDIGDQSANNYKYNSIGQLIEDHEYVTLTDLDNVVRYEYSASGLVTAVTKKNVPLVKFFYNDRNQRVKKQSFTAQGALVKTTYYVRDVQGIVEGIYESLNSNTAEVIEHPIMGAGRIGIFKRAGTEGTAYYELKDHLGNVRAVFSKSGNDTANDSYSDYYPFGMRMPNRNSLSENFYRYAFQGQEKDAETDKEAFELRLWDARIGRWLTTDPAGQYSSPYMGMGNNPSNGIDSDGAFWEELFNALGGHGWNSNAALEYQANGGTLGEWTGNNFSGYRSAGRTENGEFVGTTFDAVNDFWNYDAFDFGGRVAIGQLNQVSVDVDNGFGAGAALNYTKVQFVGGEYGNYWYTYDGYEGGFNGVLGGGASVDLSVEIFIAIYQDDRVDSPNPKDFAGPYLAYAGGAEVHAGLGVAAFGSKTYSGQWRIYSIGAGVGVGGNVKGGLELRLGKTTINNTDIKPTNQRTNWDIISNKIIHLTPLK